MDEHGTRSKALGAVVGSAVGDALGAPFEFGEPGEYGARFPSPVRGGIGEMIGGRGWRPGEFTDDTQMAIAQAESLLSHGGVQGSDLFDRFGAWAATAADVGIQTAAVLRSGLAWDRAAAEHYRHNPTHAAGNGTLMRSTPSAVFFGMRSLDETMAAARRLSDVTHGDPAAGWGTAVYHGMIHAELHGTSWRDALPGLLDWLPDDQGRYREMLSATWEPDHGCPSNGSVWGCLAQAVWAVRTTTTFDAAVVRAIDLGGDTDTVAAVAGGLAGAVYGIQQIPSRWTTYLHGSVGTTTGTRRYRLADLQRLALALIDVRATDEQAPGPPSGPVEIADGVHVANFAGATAAPTDWAVISLCRVGDRFAGHPVRRELYLIDTSSGHNHALDTAVRDAVDTIDAFRAEGRQVVVHCHAGASRTGLVIRAWLMLHRGLGAAEATRMVQDRWPLLDPVSNGSFVDCIDRWAPTYFTGASGS